MIEIAGGILIALFVIYLLVPLCLLAFSLSITAIGLVIGLATWIVEGLWQLITGREADL